MPKVKTPKKTYAEKLLDPQWQKKRLEIMARDNFACQGCFDSESTLSVHHRYYITGREPWEYPSWAYVTLCKDCHKHHHGKGGLERDFWEATCQHLMDDASRFSPMAEDIEHLIHKIADTPAREHLQCAVLHGLMYLWYAHSEEDPFDGPYFPWCTHIRDEHKQVAALVRKQ